MELNLIIINMVIIINYIFLLQVSESFKSVIVYDGSIVSFHRSEIAKIFINLFG